MKRVLITGISGFVGQHLTDYLKAHFPESVELYGTTRSLVNRDDKTFSNVKLLHAELTNQKDVDSVIGAVKPDEVYHLAALSSPAESFRAPNATIVNNVGAQIHLFEALRKYELLKTRVLIVTSSDMYGMVSRRDIPIDEKTSFHPGSPYAVSKITQDYLSMQYHASYKLPIIRVRPFTHVGPKQTEHFVLSAFAKQVALIEKGKQEPILKVGNLEAKRDFTDVRDMVRAHVLLMKKGVPGDVYNAGSGESTKIIVLLNKLLQLSTVKITTSVDPDRMRPSDIPEIRCDFRKLHRVTGWKPEIPFEQTLKDTLEYWRSVV
jgi:GDP-4-dehydro-6-deoxy-D-mannose reductase